MNSHHKKEMADPSVNFVGLDVSKARLDSFVPGGKPRTDSNNAQGHADLIKHLCSLPNPRVICEASGGYERAVVTTLLKAGVGVCVVPPARVRHFALAEGLLAKTDRIDAALLARYGDKIRPPLELPADPAAVRLREMLDLRRILSDRRVATSSQLQLAQGYLREGLQAQLGGLRAALRQINRDIATHLKADPVLCAKAKRLRQMCGVGQVLAATFLAYLPELGLSGDKTLASLVGVAPPSRRQRQTPRQAPDSWRTPRRARRALHGGSRRGYPQPDPRGLLPAPDRQGQTRQGGSRGSDAENAVGPQPDDRRSTILTCVMTPLLCGNLA